MKKGKIHPRSPFTKGEDGTRQHPLLVPPSKGEDDC
jgi:hypothetical protein